MLLIHLKAKGCSGLDGIFGEQQIFHFVLEREPLLSSFSANLTVGGLRGEKEKRSTQGRLRVDSGIGSFFKLFEVGFSSYLSFTPI